MVDTTGVTDTAGKLFPWIYFDCDDAGIKLPPQSTTSVANKTTVTIACTLNGVLCTVETYIYSVNCYLMVTNKI
jgi:hypothetical protein